MDLRRWLGAFVLAMFVASTGRAQDSAAPQAQTAEAQTQDYRDKAARGLFEAGSVAFEEGRFEEALGHFKKAYELSPNRHLLLYNIASSLDRLRRDKEALDTFERYLELNPTAPNRPAVEARVKLLQEAVERQKLEEQERARQSEEQARLAAEQQQHQQQASSQAAAPVETSEPEHHGLSPVYTWVGIGVTAAVGGIAVWSGLNTIEAKDQYESWSKKQSAGQASYDGSKKLYDDGVKRQLRTNILIGTAATVGIATAVIATFFTDWGSLKAKDVQASAVIDPTHLGLEVRHAF